MGLFQRQPINNEAPLYTLGEQKTFLVVGLGNIGKEYEKTRHNLGFMCVEDFASKNGFTGWVNKTSLHAQESIGSLNGHRVILAKPTTLMNDSGKAVNSLQHFYRIKDDDTLVIHDELAVDFGKIRIRQGGSDAGNNGVKSLIEHGVGDTWRARAGIGPKHPDQIEPLKFVLGEFDQNERSHLDAITKGAGIIISEFVHNEGKLVSETRTFID